MGVKAIGLAGRANFRIQDQSNVESLQLLPVGGKQVEVLTVAASRHIVTGGMVIVQHLRSHFITTSADAGTEDDNQFLGTSALDQQLPYSSTENAIAGATPTRVQQADTPESRGDQQQRQTIGRPDGCKIAALGQKDAVRRGTDGRTFVGPANDLVTVNLAQQRKPVGRHTQLLEKRSPPGRHLRAAVDVFSQRAVLTAAEGVHESIQGPQLGKEKQTIFRSGKHRLKG